MGWDISVLYSYLDMRRDIVSYFEYLILTWNIFLGIKTAPQVFLFTQKPQRLSLLPAVEPSSWVRGP